MVGGGPGMSFTMVRGVRGWHRDDGASSVEYALVLFAIAATMVVALFALGGPVFDLFDATCRAIKEGVSGPGSSC